MIVSLNNGVVRTLKKYAHQRETAGSSGEQIHFNQVIFQNGNVSLRKEFFPRGSEFFPLRAVPFGMENRFYHIG